MIYGSSIRLELIYSLHRLGIIHVVGLVHGETENNYYMLVLPADITEDQLPEFFGHCLRKFKELAELSERGLVSE